LTKLEDAASPTHDGDPCLREFGADVQNEPNRTLRSSPSGRAATPMTETAVLIAFAAGAHQATLTWAGNPQRPVVIELPEPLSSRVAPDGLAVAGHVADFLD
jgi:hypothetical protein